MAEGLFCIDFGSAYTKVSFRRGRRTNSEMVTHPQHTTDEFHICVPTAVVVDSSTSLPRYTFGLATEARRSGGAIQVHRNWKRELFLPPTASAAAAPPTRRPMTRLEAVIHSIQFRQLAERHGVTRAEIDSLRWLVIHATSLTLPVYSAEQAEPDDASQRLACEFFTWLRGVVLNACASLQPAPEKVEDYPVRVTVPAFGPEKELAQHPGCVRIATALRRANWKLHPDLPFLSEPYANTIGTLTQGSNCTRVADMFRRGLLITALADPRTHSNYQVVVIDVGAFTTDFAVLTLDTKGQTVLLSEIDFQSRAESVPIGMSNLDEAVVASLTPENQHYMREEAPATEWSRFRQEVYLRRRPFVSQVGEIGGVKERRAIDAAFAGFQQSLDAATALFLGSIEDVSFKELVLTGGGCTFPTIQEMLIGAAERGRSVFRKVHLPVSRTGTPQRDSTDRQVVTPLDGCLPRGATALGGTSAYFDMIS